MSYWLAARFASEQLAVPLSAGVLHGERRRHTTNFLTWAFFLSEAVKGSEQYDSSPQPVEDLASWQQGVGNGDPVASPLLVDEPALKDWSFSFPPDGAMSILAPHAFAPLPSSEHAAWIDLGKSAPPASSSISASGGSASVGYHTANAGDADLNIKLDASGVHLDLGLSVGDGVLVSSLLGTLGDIFDSVPTDTVEHLLSGLGDEVVDLLGSDQPARANELSGMGLLANTLSAEATDPLFVQGRYTDYHLVLRTHDSDSLLNASPASDGIASSSDSHALVHVLDVGHDVPGQHNGPLLALEENSLRAGFDNLL